MRVSILLPVFNGKPYVRACIASILAQSFSDFELLIGNDGSTDGSGEMIVEFRDKRVRYFETKRNLGLFANVNALIRLATGDLVRFICQDDLLNNDCIASEVAFFAQHPQIGMSFCKANVIDADENVVRRSELGDLPDVIEPNFAAKLFFCHGCMPGNLSTVCLKKAVLDDVGLFDLNYETAADHEMWVRICTRYSLGVLQKRLVDLRVHARQLSREASSGIRAISANRALRRKLLRFFSPEERAEARHYELVRQTVLDVHYALRCLQSGRFSDFREVVGILGFKDFAAGLFFWLVTVNNRLFRPNHRRLLGVTARSP